MGDKAKLKTGKLGANNMEQYELYKHLERLDKQIRVRVVNIECQQKIIAKTFHERLHQSATMAKVQEDIVANFHSNRHDDKKLRSYMLRGKAMNAEIENRKNENIAPSLQLRQWNKNFRVPYQKEYSFRPGINTRPSKVLEVRCKMWEKVAEFCTSGRERARSAPPRLRELRAPDQVERAHDHALELVGIQKWLVEKPSGQPLIDQDKVSRWREKEKNLANGAVEEFVGSLHPYRLKPGPSQRLLDVNSLYSLLCTPRPPVNHPPCSQ